MFNEYKNVNFLRLAQNQLNDADLQIIDFFLKKGMKFDNKALCKILENNYHQILSHLSARNQYQTINIDSSAIQF
jgi:hypothetical protein